MKEDDPAVTLAAGVRREMGRSPDARRAGGGMDANYLNNRGITAVGLATGYDKVHTSEEEQSISQLVKTGEAVAGLIRAAARVRV